MSAAIEEGRVIHTPIGDIAPPRTRLATYNLDRIQRLRRTNFGNWVEDMPQHPQRTYTEQMFHDAVVQCEERQMNPYIDFGYNPRFDPRNPDKPETWLVAYNRAHSIVGAEFFWRQLHPDIIEDMSILAFDEETEQVVPVLPECRSPFDELLISSACNLVSFYALEKGKTAFKIHTVPNTRDLVSQALEIFHRRNGINLMYPLLEKFGADPETLRFHLGVPR